MSIICWHNNLGLERGVTMKIHINDVGPKAKPDFKVAAGIAWSNTFVFHNNARILDAAASLNKDSSID